MRFRQGAIQRKYVADVLFVCLPGYIEQPVAICLQKVVYYEPAKELRRTFTA